MPTLLIQHAGRSRGTVLTGRVLIGRVEPNGLLIPEAAVSRIHAWIDVTGDRFYISDAKSRKGTLVGDRPIAGRHVLEDGDQIGIGSATITFHATDRLPEGTDELSIAQTRGVVLEASGGVLFACSCGAPLWAPAEWIDRRGKCEHCGERSVVPGLARNRPAKPADSAAPIVIAEPVAAPSSTTIPPLAPHPKRICSICQWEIAEDEARTTCPSCHLTFHSDCWQENRGCSAYGCASVNALATEEEKAADAEAVPEPVVMNATAEELEQAEHHDRFPVEFLLLGGSVVCSLLGLLAFGVPAGVVALGSNFYWITQRRRGASVRSGIVAAAVAISVAGIAAGLWLSAFRWLHRPLSAPWQHG